MAEAMLKLQIRWLGVAGFDFKIGNKTLLVDPFMTRPPLKDIFGGRVSPNKELLSKMVPAADHILVSHAHYDHLMDVPEIAARTGAKVFGSSNVCQLMRVFGIPKQQINELHAGDIVYLPYATINVIPAKHPNIPGYLSGKLRKDLTPPLRLRDYRMDECYSYLIEIGKIRLLMWSSISVQHAPPVDVVFLRAAASEKWYRAILNAVMPRLVIPTHWDNLFRPVRGQPLPFWAPPQPAWPPIKRINLEGFTAIINRAYPKVKVLIPETFKEYQLKDVMGQPG